MRFELVPLDAAGMPSQPLVLSDELTANCAATALLYTRIGFVAPWIGYVAVADGQPVGGGAFVGPPRDHRVEIAYYTLPAFAGHGHATRTAAALLKIARAAAPGVVVAALTLPEHNASTRVLQKLGFQFHGIGQDADAGPVWEWRLQALSIPRD